MNILAIVQARMGSTRLPGKVMLPVLNKPLMAYQIERLKHSETLDQIVIVTTSHPEDDILESFCHQQHIGCFRGSVDDVLSRFEGAAQHYAGDVLVRITGDCPLIDPHEIDETVSQFLMASKPCDYLSNTQPRIVPRGYDVEVFSRHALFKAVAMDLTDSEKEHVTLTFYQHPELYSIRTMAGKAKNLDFRLTVDTAEDFELVRRILEELYPRNRYFSLEDVSKLFTQHPEWLEINRHVQQKST